VIVCGHYGCGGVNAALEDHPHGLVDNWLRHIRNIYLRNQSTLDAIPDKTERLSRLCELNVIDQVVNVGNTTILRDAWERGQGLRVHGWIYGLADGLLRDLKVSLSSVEDLQRLLHSRH